MTKRKSSKPSPHAVTAGERLRAYARAAIANNMEVRTENGNQRRHLLIAPHNRVTFCGQPAVRMPKEASGAYKLDELCNKCRRAADRIADNMLRLRASDLWSPDLEFTEADVLAAVDIEVTGPQNKGKYEQIPLEKTNHE